MSCEIRESGDEEGDGEACKSVDPEVCKDYRKPARSLAREPLLPASMPVAPTVARADCRRVEQQKRLVT